MHQVTIEADCHRMHYLFQDGAPPTLDAVAHSYSARTNQPSDFGLACSICDYGTEDLSAPGLVAFYVEQVDA
jgi:hypothetical protein